MGNSEFVGRKTTFKLPPEALLLFPYLLVLIFIIHSQPDNERTIFFLFVYACFRPSARWTASGLLLATITFAETTNAASTSTYAPTPKARV
jgi:hypothetical protein